MRNTGGPDDGATRFASRRLSAPVREPFLDVALLPRIWRYSWPTILYSLLQWIVGTADLYMVGRLGHEAISAVGFSRQIMMVVMIGALAVSTGAMTLVAQNYGAGKDQETAAAARQSLLLACAGALAIAALGNVLTLPFLRGLGAQDQVLRLAEPYLRVVFCGVVFMLPNFIVAAVFRGAGDMLTPLKIAAGLNGVNILANYLFIFGIGPFPRLEVTGAAVGTIIARGVGLLWGLTLLSGGRARVHIRWRVSPVIDLSMMRRILRVGVPSAVQGLFRNGARILFFRIVAGSGMMTAATAALTIGFQIRMVVIMPALAFNAAATALVGQALGAGRTRMAEGFGTQTIRLCALLLLLVNLAVFVLGEILVGVFTPSPEVLAVGGTMLRWFAVAQFFSALSIVCGGALTGGGDTKPPMYYTALSQWLILLPAATVLQFHTPLGLTGSWLAWTVAPIVQAALTYLRFRRGVWKLLTV